MIKEDYVSFEVAKLLKEKGFVEKTFTYFDNELLCNGGWFEWNNSPMGQISAPTLQMAMKWLREVYNLCIEPYRTAAGYLYTVSNIPYGSCKANPKDGGDDEDSGQWTTYEKACEAAIKYCLENLI